MKKNLILFLLTLFSLPLLMQAQVANYTFSQSSGTYTPITGGTLYKNTGTVSIDDDNYTNLPIGFSFTYNGVSYTNFSINANGFMALGTTIASSYAPLSTGATNNVIAAMGNDLLGRQFVTGSTDATTNVVTVTAGSTAGMAVGDLLTGTGIATGATITGLTATTITMSVNATTTGTGRNIRAINCGEIRYETIGTAPNRTLVVQWSKFSRYTTSAPSDVLNFQIRLNESTNTVSIVYNNIYSNASITPQVGIRGASAADFNNRTTTTSWSASTAGASNTATMTHSATVIPASGQTYTWTPPQCTGTPATPTIAVNSPTACSGSSYILSSTGHSTSAGITYQWKVSTTAGGPYADVTAGTGATTTSYNTGALAEGSYYFVMVTTCANSGLTSTSNEISKIVTASPTVSVSPSTTTRCLPSSTPVTITATGAGGTGTLTYAWTPATGLDVTTGTTVNASPTATTTYTTTVTDANGCTATATSAISVSNAPVFDSVKANASTICSGGSSVLTGYLKQAPVNQMVFSTSTGAVLEDTTGSTQIVGSNLDDAPSVGLAMPFSFSFNGTTYSHFAASPDGWVIFQNSTTTPSSQFTNSVVSTTNIPKIYPFWDDLSTGTTGNVKYKVVGTAPNRKLVINWFVTIPRNTSGAANASIQAWIHEGTGQIDYVYGTGGTGNTASIGMTGNATNYISINGSGVASTTTPNDNIATTPASGTKYSFTHPVNTFSWSDGTASVGTTNPLTVNPTTTTSYTLTATNPAGCATTSAATTVTVNPSYLIVADSVKCNSYYWAISDSTYTVTGTDTVNIPTAAGCDSIIVLNITINNSSSDTTAATACDSYTWAENGMTYSASGFYTANYTNENGCDSNKVLNLTLNAETDTLYQIACGSFTWDVTGVTYSSTQIVTITNYNQAGCDSSKVLNLTINSILFDTVTTTACNTYTWDLNGETYTASGMYNDTLKTALNCDSVVTLNLTINSSNSSSQTHTACNVYNWGNPAIDYTTSGTYIDTFTNASGCDSVVTLTLTINNSTSFVNEVVACGSYTWAADGVTYTASGTYYDTLTNAAGCDSFLTLNLTINPLPTVTVSMDPTSGVSCNGGTVTITATGADTYAWSPTDDLDVSTGATVVSTPTANRVYTVTGTDANGCTNTATATVVKDTFTMNIVSTPDSICLGSSATFTASSTIPDGSGPQVLPTGYCTPTVTQSGTTGDYIRNFTFGTISNLNTPDGDYTDYTATKNATVVIGNTYTTTVQSGPSWGQGFRIWIDYNRDGDFNDAGESVFTSASSTALQTGSVTISAAATPGVTRMRVAARYSATPAATENCLNGGYGEFEDYKLNIVTMPPPPIAWTASSDLSSTTTATTIATPTTSGTHTYYASYTTPNGCVLNDSVSVYVRALPTVSASAASSTVCAGTSTNLTATGAATYTWSPATGLSATTGDVVTATPATTTTYTVAGTDASGCVDTVLVTVTVNPVTTTNTSATACVNYTWAQNGTTYTTSGIYRDTMNDVNGCDSILVLNLTINDSIPLAATATPSVICLGDSTTLIANVAPVLTTMTVGTGTTTNSSSSYPAPFGAYYYGAKNQMLILASELTAMGYSAGQITSLAFDVVSPNTTALTNFEVQIGSTTATAMTTTFLTGLTSVYTNASYVPSSTGGYDNNKITFTTPFTWDGTSNIVVQTCFNNSIWTSNATFRNTTTPFVSTTTYYADAAGVCASATSTSGIPTYSTRPNMRFEITQMPTVEWNPGTLADSSVVTPTTTTDYTVTVTSPKGCVSTQTVNVTVNEPTVVIEDIDVCDSFTWNTSGTTYTTSGTYYFTEPNADVNGCNINHTLNLVIRNSSASTQTESACGSYTWSLNDSTYTASGTYVYTIPNAAGCDSIITLDLTIGGSGTVTPSTNEDSSNVNNSTVSYYDPSCNIISTVTATTDLGLVTSLVNVATTAGSFNGQPYVLRSFDITTQNAGGGEVTLYFLQSEFDDYNANAGTFPQIEASGSNLYITAFHSPMNGGGAGPLGHDTAAANVELITPTSVVYNTLLSRWEVKFTTSTFSGFFAHTVKTLDPLPVVLGDIRAYNRGSEHVVVWNTLKEATGDIFELERSKDGNNFTKLATIDAKGSPSEYNFVDVAPYQGTTYYRILMIDNNGAKNYTKIVNASLNQSFSINAYPNPTNKDITVSINGSRSADAKIIITDVSGRILNTINRIENNEVKISLEQYAQGIYFVKYIDGDIHETIKINKN